MMSARLLRIYKIDQKKVGKEKEQKKTWRNYVVEKKLVEMVVATAPNLRSTHRAACDIFQLHFAIARSANNIVTAGNERKG
jgi:hypothetical protein